MSPTPAQARLEAAKMEAERARRRFATSVTAAQQRLKPGALADQAWSGVKDKGSDLADGAVEAVKARPAAAAGAVAALFLFLARRPIVSGASKLWTQVRKNNGHNGAAKKPKIASVKE
jgi:hypothetical protein